MAAKREITTAPMANLPLVDSSQETEPVTQFSGYVTPIPAAPKANIRIPAGHPAQLAAPFKRWMVRQAVLRARKGLF